MVLRDADTDLRQVGPFQVGERPFPVGEWSRTTTQRPGQCTLGDEPVDGFVTGQGTEFLFRHPEIGTERKHDPLYADVFRCQDFFFP